MSGIGSNGSRLASPGQVDIAREAIELFASGAVHGAIVGGLLACIFLICADLASPIQGVAAVIAAAICSIILFRLASRTWLQCFPWLVAGDCLPGAGNRQPDRHLAHELRTELAIITLELDKIPDAGARAIREDVERLADRIDSYARTVAPE